MPLLDRAALRDLAVRAANAGAAVVRNAAAAAAASGEAALAEVKGLGDYVTATDRAAETAVLEVLRAGSDGIAVLAEESGLSGPTSAWPVSASPQSGGVRPGPDGRVWVVDPLDGTTNFMLGFPVVGVSVGLIEDGRPVVGAVVAPMLGAAWSAARDLGAFDAAGRRLRVRDGDGGGVAATGFPFRRPERRPRYLGVLSQALEISEDLRRAGAASLDLAYSAQGTFDGHFELGLSLWDIAAGALLVVEAGGVVSDWEGDPDAVYRSGDILAGSPAWHERMLDVTRSRVHHGAP